MHHVNQTAIVPVCLALVIGLGVRSAPAEGIDLDCATLSQQMVERLAAEGLLSTAAGDRQRAFDISRELCGGAEERAQQQHETEQQEALDDWFFTNQPDKAGNKRLKNLKR